MPIAGPSVSMTWYGRAILRHSGSAATPVASLRPSPFRRSVTPFQKLSVGSNKTAVMAQPVGAGAHHTRRVLFAKAGLDGHVRAFREHAAPLKVPLVPTYRHLGMQHALHGKMATEIAYRSAQARAAFQEARRKVFKAPGVPLLRKVFILRASVLPNLLYGAGAWPPLGAREYSTFAGCLSSLYRQVLCTPYDAISIAAFEEIKAMARPRQETPTRPTPSQVDASRGEWCEEADAWRFSAQVSELTSLSGSQLEVNPSYIRLMDSSQPHRRKDEKYLQDALQALYANRCVVGEQSCLILLSNRQEVLSWLSIFAAWFLGRCLCKDTRLLVETSLPETLDGEKMQASWSRRQQCLKVVGPKKPSQEGPTKLLESMLLDALD
eukprot:s3548_g2.t2